MGQIGRAVHGLVHSGRQSDGRYGIEQAAIDRHGTENSTNQTQQVRQEDKENNHQEENNHTANEDDIRPQTTENKKVKDMVITKRVRIPRGEEKEDVYRRKEILIRELLPLIGTKVKCPALDNRDVEFIFFSIDETATHAARRYQSTLVALHVKEAIRVAKFVKSDTPKETRQKRKMKFQKIYELKGELKGIGEYRLMVGERKNKRVLHYCITSKKANK